LLFPLLTLTIKLRTLVDASSSGTEPNASVASLTSSSWLTAPAAASTCERRQTKLAFDDLDEHEKGLHAIPI
jgi:hypothetical protein